MLFIDQAYFFLDKVWQISVFLVKFIVLSLLIYGFYRNRDKVKQPYSFFKDSLTFAFGKLLLETSFYFILGIIGASLVASLYSNIWIAYFVFVLIAGATLFFERNNFDFGEKTDENGMFLAFSVFYLFVFIAALLTFNAVLEKLLALLFYGIVFWRI